MNHLLTSVTLSACTALACASVAVAQPYDTSHVTEQISRTVELRDVDVNTPAGAKVAADRIRDAAEQVCNGNTTRWWPDYYGYAKCRDQALDRALATLQAPLVSAALHRKAPTTGLAAR
jgi:UrcA family protein